MNGGLLPIPCVLALLRLVRGHPPEAGDEDALFDEFAVVGRDSVIARATVTLLGFGSETQRATFRDRALDAVLVDMLGQHAKLRLEDQRMEEAA